MISLQLSKKVPWSVAALVVPALVAGVGVVRGGGKMERELVSRVGGALAVAGYRGEVGASGRDVVVSDVVPRDAASVRRVAAGVPGVRSVALREVPAGWLTVLLRADEVVLSGTAADAAEHDELIAAVHAAAPDHRVTDMVAPDSSHRLPVLAAAAAALLRAALDSRAHDFGAAVDGGGLDVTATTADDEHATALRIALRDAAGDLPVREHVVIGARPAVGDLDVAALNDSVARLLRGSGGIRFQPGSAEFEGDGAVLVERVGRLLRVAPRVTTTVVGHASAAHDREDSRALAGARANRVRDVLAARGVPLALLEVSTSVDAAAESDPAARLVDVRVR
ncbi:OmpA family protein [Umezawaea beigongshangensis]|uniref:OmpA family protein n=1 Tax=Umezawaea beigongshangensis TaxID=2780383 RepID=UPI0018F1AD7D|nr:OmpA family protein [Umezawaea beigongshangensis]